MNISLQILNKPYDLLEHKKFKFLGSFGTLSFVFVFLLIFQPFGFDDLSLPDLLKSLGLYNVFALLILVIHMYVLQDRLIRHFTVGNTILWALWMVLMVSISNYFVNAYLFQDGHFKLISFFYLLGSTSAEALIPITLIILLHYNYVLKKRYEKSIAINSSLPLKNNAQAGEKILIETQNPKNNLTLDIHSLLYIKSEENYIDVYFTSHNKIEHQLIRSTLTKVEKDLVKHNALLRCHKSYIVNLKKVDEVSGNSLGYFLKISGIEKTVPVSRKFNKNIQDLIPKK